MISANLNYVLISVSKGENADIQAMEPDGDYGPCLCIFDILLYNGIVLSNKPLQERIAYIKKTFNQVDNKIRFTEQKSVSTKLVYIYIILIIIYQYKLNEVFFCIFFFFELHVKVFFKMKMFCCRLDYL